MSFVPPKIAFSGDNALVENTSWERTFQLKKLDGTPQPLSAWGNFRCEFKNVTGPSGVTTNCPQPVVSVVDAANGIVKVAIPLANWPASPVTTGVFDIEATLVGSSPARTERLAYGSWTYRVPRAVATTYDL